MRIWIQMRIRMREVKNRRERKFLQRLHGKYTGIGIFVVFYGIGTYQLSELSN